MVSKSTLGDLEVLLGTPDSVKAAYKEAIVRNDKDWFALNSSRAQLQLMKNLGYGKGYEYDHEAEEGFSGQNYFPDAMAREQFYQPKETGFEREIGKRLEYWTKLRAKKAGE